MGFKLKTMVHCALYGGYPVGDHRAQYGLAPTGNTEPHSGLPEDVWELLSMLKHKRPYDSPQDEEFCRKYIRPLASCSGVAEYEEDSFGNIIIVTSDDSTSLFSAHTDTVHRTHGMQSIVYDSEEHWAFKTDDEPLGADDAVGCWIMMHMIRAGVPGTYVFHRGEELGGLGSQFIVDTAPSWASTYDRCIAFDRRGDSNIITHQMVGRCCSDNFANTLAHRLNAIEPTFTYEPCDTGSFTDSANYVEHISECTNISVGYYKEHTKNETLDVRHAIRLKNACLILDWETLPTEHVYDPEGPWQSANYFGSAYHKNKQLNTVDVSDLWEDVYDEDYPEFSTVEEAMDYVLEEPYQAGQMLFDLTRRNYRGK